MPLSTHHNNLSLSGFSGEVKVNLETGEVKPSGTLFDVGGQIGASEGVFSLKAKGNNNIDSKSKIRLKGKLGFIGGEIGIDTEKTTYGLATIMSNILDNNKTQTGNKVEEVYDMDDDLDGYGDEDYP